MAIEIYPVVHINTVSTAVGQAGIALESGADGVFLIDHSHGSLDWLSTTFNSARANYPGAFLGINILQMNGSFATFQTLNNPDTWPSETLPDGLWVDNADIDKDRTLELRVANPHLASIRYLGGVAFKYTQLSTENPDKASAEALRLQKYVDVVTTSGPGTGAPPSPAKIKAMKEVIGTIPLAVASGIDIGNIESYAVYLDQLLVASSIETTLGSGIFDKQKLADLIQMAHEL